MSDRNLLSRNRVICDLKTRSLLLNIAVGELGVREATGHNDGVRVTEYLSYCGFKKGHAWCAAFVSWVYGQAGFSEPRTVWSPALFPLKRCVKTALPADVFGIYFPSMGRIAHAGIIEKIHGDWLLTIEGNTNIQGGREGDGVYRKRRHLKLVSKIADWIGYE